MILYYKLYYIIQEGVSSGMLSSGMRGALVRIYMRILRATAPDKGWITPRQPWLALMGWTTPRRFDSIRSLPNEGQCCRLICRDAVVYRQVQCPTKLITHVALALRPLEHARKLSVDALSDFCDIHNRPVGVRSQQLEDDGVIDPINWAFCVELQSEPCLVDGGPRPIVC